MNFDRISSVKLAIGAPPGSLADGRRSSRGSRLSGPNRRPETFGVLLSPQTTQRGVMKKDERETQGASGLFIGSEPLGSDPDRRMKDTGDDDSTDRRDKGDADSADKGDDDSTDKADTDTTDKGDRGDDSRDADGKD